MKPSDSLPSPPPSPQHQTRSSPPLHFSGPVATSMNRSLLHGGPLRGNAGASREHQDVRPSQDARFSQDPRPSQDARSNLAVQPAANAGTFKLKKNAVKLVSSAGPAPNALLPNASLHTAPHANDLGIGGPEQSATLTSSPVSISVPTPGPSIVPGSKRPEPKAIKEYVHIHNQQNTNT